jgi:hypothetical protein
MPNTTMDRLECAVTGQLQRLVRWQRVIKSNLVLGRALEAARITLGLTLHLLTDAKWPFWKKTLRARLRARCGWTARKRARVARSKSEDRESDKNANAIQQGIDAA